MQRYGKLLMYALSTGRKFPARRTISQMIPAAVGFLLFLVGVLLASVSAPHYEMLLLSSTLAMAGALGCFVFAFRRRPRFVKALLVVCSLVALETIVANMMRLSPGLRMLDLL